MFSRNMSVLWQQGLSVEHCRWCCSWFITCSRAARFVLRASFSCRMLSTCSWLTALWLATCSTNAPQARQNGTGRTQKNRKEPAHYSTSTRIQIEYKVSKKNKAKETKVENQNNNNRTVKQWQKQRRVRERTVQQHRQTESSRQKGFPLPQWYYYYYSVIWKAQFLSVPTYNKIVDILYKQSEYESILITESLWQGNIFTDKWANSKFKSNLTLFPHLLPPSLPPSDHLLRSTGFISHFIDQSGAKYYSFIILKCGRTAVKLNLDPYLWFGNVNLKKHLYMWIL